MLTNFQLNCGERTAQNIMKAIIICNHYNLVSNSLHEFTINNNSKLFGYREKYIIQNLKNVEIKRNDGEYLVLTFSSDENSFDYECYTNRITG